MNKFLLVFANYADYRQQVFEKYMSPRNKLFCDIHKCEYLEYTQNIKKYRDNFTWSKFFEVKNLLDDKTLKDGDVLIHLDADMCIVKPDISLETNKSFSYSIDSGNSHCMGWFSIKINDWSRKLIDLILDETRYENLKDKQTIHPAFNRMSSFWSEFREQASWYSLCGIQRHSWIPFWNLSNYGWHSDKNEDTVFSLEELYDNVGIFDTKYNVTEMDGETDGKFNIIKTNPNDVIIRHFSGGQLWRTEWFNI